MMSNILILTAQGEGGCKPNEEPWNPDNGKPVKIINNSQSSQTLWNISNGCLVERGHGPVTTITIADGNGGEWHGRAGGRGNNGTYLYEDGESEAAPRNGHIDPS